MPFYIGFAATWVTLLIAPIATALTAWHRPAYNKQIVRRVALSCVILIATFGLALFVGVQTSSVVMNSVVCLAAFLAYCFLMVSLWYLRPRALGVIAGLLGSITLIPALFLGTVGVPALLLILSDYFNPPLSEEQVRPDLACRVTGWGAAFSDEGYDVHLYRHLPWLPFLRREVADVSVNETHPGSGPKKASCASVAANVR